MGWEDTTSYTFYVSTINGFSGIDNYTYGSLREDSTTSTSTWSTTPLLFTEWYDSAVSTDADELTYAYEGGSVTVVKVEWHDSAASENYTLYYALNHGIATDPTVDPDTILNLGEKSSMRGDMEPIGQLVSYNIEYKGIEKTALLNQFQRYGSIEGNETFSNTLDATISEMVDLALGYSVATEPLLNFKKTDSLPFEPEETSIFSTLGVASEANTGLIGPAASMSSGPAGGY